MIIFNKTTFSINNCSLENKNLFVNEEEDIFQYHSYIRSEIDKLNLQI